MQVNLSRRNLVTLLSKLDRVAAGESSACTLVKMDQGEPVMVTAFEDDVYYANREPGPVFSKDVPNERS